MFIIPENKQSMGRSLLGGMAQGIPAGLSQSIGSLLKRREAASEEAAKGKRTQELYGKIFNKSFDGDADASNDLLGSKGQSPFEATPQQLIAMKMSGDKGLSDAADAIIEMQKREQPKIEEQKRSENYGTILDEMENELEGGGAGRSAYIKSFLPGQGKKRRSTARFQSLGTSLLGLAQKIALKQGIRNQKEFDAFMKRTIPNESDTRETALGKIDALRNYIKLEATGSSSIQNKNQKSNSSFIKMKTPDGKIVKVPHDKAEAASRAGGKIIP